MSIFDFKSVLIALLPKGKLWDPKPGGDFDLFLEAKAENLELIHDRLAAAAYVRDPRLTTMLPDLEKEYRIIPETVLTEEERRTQLVNAKYVPNGTGSASYLQDRLQEAGFDLVVKANDPAIDPRILADISYQMMAGGGASYAGNQDATDQGIAYESQANGATTFAGNQFAIAGYFNYIKNDPILYSLAMHYGYWPSVFFIVGSFSDWTPLKDWNMEKPGNTDWIPGPMSSAVKEIFINPQVDQDGLVSEYEMYSQYIRPWQTGIEDSQDYADGENRGGIDTEDRQGRAISFNGVDQYATYEYPLKNYTKGTFEAIAKIKSGGAGAYGTAIFAQENQIERTGLTMEGNGIISRFGGSAPSGKYAESPAASYSGEYQYIVGIWEVDESAKLIVDGKIFDSGEAANTDYFRLGPYGETPDPDYALYNAKNEYDDYLECEIAYCAFYDEKKSNDWALSRYYQLMKYGVRRLVVNANNNQSYQQLTALPYSPDNSEVYPVDLDIINDYLMESTLKDLAAKWGEYDLGIGNTTEILSPYGRARRFNGATSFALGASILHGRSAISIEAVATGYAAPTGISLIQSYSAHSDANTLFGIFFNDDGDADMDVEMYCTIVVGGTRYDTALTPEIVTDGNWYHFFMTWESGEKLKFYIDGTLRAESATTITGIIDYADDTDAYRRIEIGRDSHNATYYGGDIARVVFYENYKDAAYVQNRALELLTSYDTNNGITSVSDMHMAPTGRDGKFPDLNRSCEGTIVGTVSSVWNKYGKTAVFGGSGYIDLGSTHPFMASVDQSVLMVFKKAAGSTPTYQTLLSNGSALSTDKWHIYLDNTNYPSVDIVFECSDAGGNPKSHKRTVTAAAVEDYFHLGFQRYYIGGTTNYEFRFNGESSVSVGGFAGLPSVTNTACRIGHKPASDYFVGEICELRLYTWNGLGFNLHINDYNKFIATNIENGSYVEQILDTPITSSRDITGVAWGDGVSATPYLMVQNPTTAEWETIWMGSSRSDAQHFTATAPNGLSAIRLYNGSSSDGYVSWDDIQLIDPQVTRGQVQLARKERLKQLILKHKPMHSWCVLITDYV
jgi:hypothetical protein